MHKGYFYVPPPALGLEFPVVEFAFVAVALAATPGATGASLDTERRSDHKNQSRVAPRVTTIISVLWLCPACLPFACLQHFLFVSFIWFPVLFCFKDTITHVWLCGPGAPISSVLSFPFCEIQEKTCHKGLEDSHSQPLNLQGTHGL